MSRGRLLGHLPPGGLALATANAALAGGAGRASVEVVAHPDDGRPVVLLRVGTTAALMEPETAVELAVNLARAGAVARTAGQHRYDDRAQDGHDDRARSDPRGSTVTETASETKPVTPFDPAPSEPVEPEPESAPGLEPEPDRPGDPSEDQGEGESDADAQEPDAK